MSKGRVNMWVAGEFDQVVKNIQREVMKKEGKHISTVGITSKITKEDIERIIISNREDIKLKFDRRKM